MRTLLTLLEILIVSVCLWLVLPDLIFGREFTHILPGIRLSTNLSLKHLVQLAVLILFYAALFINRGPGAVGRYLSGLSPAVKALAIFTLAFSLYLHALPGHSGDTIPTKLIPVSIIEEHDLDLDEFRYAVFGGHYYSMIAKDDHFYSSYPIFPGITITPVYMAVKLFYPDAFACWHHEYSRRNGDLLDGIVSLMHKFSAAIIAAAAVTVFWLIAFRLDVAPIVRLPATVAFAAGSPMMSSMASQVWSHGPAILFMLVAVFFSAASREDEQTNLGLALGGLAAAWSVACRPTGLAAASLLTLYILIKYGRRSLFFGAAFLLLLLGIVYLNLDIYGKFFGGYQGQVDKFSRPTLERLYRLLMSPSRGLIPFAPYVLVLLLYIPKLWQRKIDLLTLAMLAAATEIAIYSCWSIWWGGNCFGPRLLSDCIMWILLGILAANVHTAQLRGIVPKTVWLGSLLLVAYAACLHVTGGIYGDRGWERDFHKEERSLMNWKNSQITWTLTAIRHDPDNKWQQESRGR